MIIMSSRRLVSVGVFACLALVGCSKSEVPPSPTKTAAAAPATADPVTCKAFVDKLVGVMGAIYNDPALRQKLQSDCEKHQGDLTSHAKEVECVMRAGSAADIDGCKADFFMKW